MKRLIAISSLSLAAALLVPSVASAQQPIYPTKVAPASFTSSVTPKRDRTRPYRFTTTGRLGIPATLPVICPAGQTNRSYCVVPPRPLLCLGSVTIKFKRGTRTISTRSVTLRSDCTYRSRITFRTTRARGRLRVQARFNGNLFLTAKTASTKTVRGG